MFSHLAGDLRCGDVCIEGSGNFSDLRQQLMPWGECQALLQDYCDRIGLAPDAQGFVVKCHFRLYPGMTPGAHDARTRKMGDMVLVDVHLDVNAAASVKEGHEIALEARRRAMNRKDVLNVMTHVDPVDVA